MRRAFKEQAVSLVHTLNAFGNLFLKEDSELLIFMKNNKEQYAKCGKQLHTFNP